MIIRAAALPDIPAAASVAAAAYAAAFAEILEAETIAPYNAAFFTARCTTSLTAAHKRLRVAAQNGAIVGFCLMTDGHIDMIFVAPTALGTGAGHALLADAEASGALSLECFAANARARRFYERHLWHLADTYSRPFAGRMRDFVRYERRRIG